MAPLEQPSQDIEIDRVDFAGPAPGVVVPSSAESRSRRHGLLQSHELRGGRDCGELEQEWHEGRTVRGIPNIKARMIEKLVRISN